MIFKSKRVQPGTKRTITKFLWFPTRIGRETRWLEKASILQEWQTYIFSGTDNYVNIAWVDI